MTALAVGITLPVEDGLSARDLVGLIVEAERCGYDTALCGEVAGPEVFSLLGLALASTTRIRLASGIVAVYTRSPALTAMGFATLSSWAPGRIVAGLGSSSPIVVGSWHGREFDAPLATTEEFVEMFRRALSGEKLATDGRRLRSNGFRLAISPGSPIPGSAAPVVPVWLAAINPGMLALAGRVADAVFLTWCPPAEVASKIVSVAAGACSVDRAPDAVEVVTSFWGYAGPRPEVARERLRRSVLGYAMVPTHRAAFAHAFPGLDQAGAAWDAGDRTGALRHVDDGVVDMLCAIGPEAVRDRVLEYREAGVDLPIVLVTGAEPGDTDGPRATIRVVAEALGLDAARSDHGT